MSIVPTCINYLAIVLPSLHTITTLHPRVLNYLLHNQTGIFSITQLEKKQYRYCYCTKNYIHCKLQYSTEIVDIYAPGRHGYSILLEIFSYGNCKPQLNLKLEQDQIPCALWPRLIVITTQGLRYIYNIVDISYLVSFRRGHILLNKGVKKNNAPPTSIVWRTWNNHMFEITWLPVQKLCHKVLYITRRNFNCIVH